MMTFVFLWLHNQTFYKNLQATAVKPMEPNIGNKIWADLGCSTGLLTRLAHKLKYKVTGFDINTLSLIVAKIISPSSRNISYKNQDFFTLTQTFDVVSATSLLSVVDNEKEALLKLISLLKDDSSTLIIIEPTEKLSRDNTWKLIHNLKTFWFYKGLLVWAKARETKEIDPSIFEEIDNISISEQYHLEGMVCIRYIQRKKVMHTEK